MLYLPKQYIVKNLMRQPQEADEYVTPGSGEHPGQEKRQGGQWRCLTEKSPTKKYFD